MKQLIYGGIIGLFAMMSMTACKKNHAPLLEPTKGTITTDGKMLIFESVEEYEQVVSHTDDESQQAFLQTISALKYDNYFSTHPSTTTSPASEPEMDDFLGQLLNKDGVIQIGKHLYRVDLERDEVFVLASERKMTADYEDFLKGNTANKQVEVYSAGDDVLYLVNNWTTEKCGGVGGGTYSCHGIPYYGQIIAQQADGAVWRLHPGVKFFRAGIYFRLTSWHEIWAFPSPSNVVPMYKVSGTMSSFSVEIFCRYPQGWYKRRPCNSGSIGTQSPGFYYSSSLAEYRRTFYSGSRNLNGYYFFIQGRVRYTTGTVTLASPYGGRNINSPY